MSYQTHYGIQLLDDIHNYFPSILYEPEQFRNVAELLHYIRNQTRNRFDLFSAGQATHRARANTRPSRMQVTPLTQTIFIDESHNNLQGVASQILRELLTPSTAINPMLTSVVVRPTDEEIATATTVETVGEEGEMCPICQDTIGVGTEARTLNFCEHSFHIGCIDTWFTRNVRCPVCRHDIREGE
jgi:hypothetical protein